MTLRTIALTLALAVTFTSAAERITVTAPPTVARDKHGKIKRSERAKDEFKKRTGFPQGRPGFVIDHIVPLACGGADDPSNMLWQSIESSREKDRWELRCELWNPALRPHATTAPREADTQ